MLGFEGIASEMRAEIKVMGAQVERGANDDEIEDGGGGVDDELAAAGGADNAAKVGRVDFGDGDDAFFAEETAGALGVAVATPDGVTLAFE